MEFRIGFFAFLLTLGIALFSPPVLSGDERVHVVQRGETFFSIARTFGVRAEDLMRHNGITDPTRLMTGQRLKIPSSAQPVPNSVAFTSYRVARGDTLFGIARNFSVTVGAIREANNLSENHVLREGETLKIPAVAAVNTAPPIVATAPPAVTQNPPAVTAASPVHEARPTENIVANSLVRWPITAQEVNYMTGKLEGVVITGVRLEPVTSLTRGTVLSAGPYRGFGRVVIIQADGGYLYVYGGCEALSVREGDRVGPGSELGRLGVDAVSGKPQLFFMVYKSNIPIDPATAPRA